VPRKGAERCHRGMQLPKALAFPKRLLTQVVEDEVPDLAAGLAYRFLFAIFPFMIFLAAMAAFVASWLGLGDPTAQIIGGLRDNLPPDIAKQLAPQLEQILGQTRPALLSVGAITALWAAQGGVASLVKAMNTAYDIDERRGFVAKTGTALVLTVVGSVGILVAFVTLVGGSVLTQQAVTSLGIAPGTWTAISLLRFPAVLVLVGVAVALLFHFGPDVRVSFRWTLTGGFVFAVAWVLVTVLFGLYVANLANYANTYGALGGVVVLMLWFYLTALILLVAAEVVSMLAADGEPERLERRRAETRSTEGGPVGRATKKDHGAPRAEGTPAGLDVGPTGLDGRRATPAALGVGATGPSGRRHEPRPRVVGTRRSQPAGGRAFAVAVLAIGALIGAITGREVGQDD
jgi:membrane protein